MRTRASVHAPATWTQVISTRSPCSTRLTSSASVTAHVWLAVPSFGLTVIEVELTQLDRAAHDEMHARTRRLLVLQLVRFEISAVFALGPTERAVA